MPSRIKQHSCMPHPPHLLHARHGRQRLAALPLIGLCAATPAALAHHAGIAAAHAGRAGHGACMGAAGWTAREGQSDATRALALCLQNTGKIQRL